MLQFGSGITIGSGIGIGIPPATRLDYLIAAGGGGGGTNPSGAGGSGVVIIRHLASLTANTTGSPTVTTSGGYTVYHFTSSGTMTF